METKFGWISNGPVIIFEACTNLTFEGEHSHVLFLNTDQSVTNKNINFNVNRFWDLKTIGIREKEQAILPDFQDSIYLNYEDRYGARLLSKNRFGT